MIQALWLGDNSPYSQNRCCFCPFQSLCEVFDKCSTLTHKNYRSHSFLLGLQYQQETLDWRMVTEIVCLGFQISFVLPSESSFIFFSWKIAFIWTWVTLSAYLWPVEFWSLWKYFLSYPLCPFQAKMVIFCWYSPPPKLCRSSVDVTRVHHVWVKFIDIFKTISSLLFFCWKTMFLSFLETTGLDWDIWEAPLFSWKSFLCD